MLGHEVHSARGWVGGYKLGDCPWSALFNLVEFRRCNILDKAIQRAKKEPENQHHIAVAGPPAAKGEDHVADTAQVSGGDSQN
jgi:hypothetical protein